MVQLEKLLELLRYNPDTGEFIWRVDLGRRYLVGKVAGSINYKGYRTIYISGRNYMAHRLAYFVMTGGWPEHDVDHINGIKDDNRWENLRSATRSQNMHNAKLYSTNKSGVKGVRFSADTGLWVAQLECDRVGYSAEFETLEEADNWVRKLRLQLHGEFTNHGSKRDDEPKELSIYADEEFYRWLEQLPDEAARLNGGKP